MLVSRAVLLEALASVPRALCGDQNAELVARGMSRYCSANPMPTARLGVLGLEFRLGDDMQIDVSVPLVRQDRLHLEASGYTGPAAGSVDSRRAWRSVHSLCAWWNQTDGILGPDRLVWLEFDIHPMSKTSASTPNVLVQLKAESKVALEPKRQERYLRSLHRMFFAENELESLTHAFSQWRKALPEKAYMRFLGAFLGRQFRGYRMCIADLSAKGLQDCLFRMGWSGGLVLNECLSELGGAEGEVIPAVLNVDLGFDGRMGRKVGIDFRFGHWNEVDRNAGAAFLDRLVRMGFAREQKAEALLALPPVQAVAFDGQHIPRAWRLHHVKVQLDENQILDAKAYAGQTVVGFDDYPLSI